MLIGTKEINEKECEIHVDLHGNWQVKLDDEIIGRSDSLKSATAQASSKLSQRKVKVAVDFYMPNNGQHGIVTGINSKTRKAMVKMTYSRRNRAEQLDTYTRVFKEDAPQDKRERYIEVNQQARELKAEADRIMKEHGSTLGDLVNNAIDEAMKEQPRAAV